MIKVFFILLFPILLFSKYLYVGSQPQSGNRNGDIKIEDINTRILPSLKVDDTSIIKDIPIYVKTNSNQKVVLNISDIEELKNSDDEVINTELYWVVGGSETKITKDQDFTILDSRDGRDGTTVVGYIRVKIPSISSSQTNGTYSFTDHIKTGLKTKVFFTYIKRYSDKKDFTCNTEVSLVAVASFSNSSLYKDGGKKFISDSVDFGTFSFDINTQIKNLYIKSNSKKNYKITFLNTPPLTHVSDSGQTIGVSYFFDDTKIVAGTSFTPLIGKSDGSESLGTLKFQTEEITGSKLAGDYEATVNVNITLE